MLQTEVKLSDFLLKDHFYGVTDQEYAIALEMVRTTFIGVESLWSIMSEDEREAKRRLCISWLLGWQLMQLYPSKVKGVPGMGAMPLTSKGIADVRLHFRNLVRQDDSGILDLLMTNPFGLQALSMIQSAPENYILQR